MLQDDIYKKYVEALKARDRKRSDFLSFVRAELKNVAIDLKKEKLEDSEVLTILNKQKKRLQESKESAVSSNRQDLIEEANNELVIIGEYLPKLMEESEVISIVESTIKELGAASMKDMGRVMKEVISIVGVRADSKMLSTLVKNKLASS